jgi:hypothetical protein
VSPARFRVLVALATAAHLWWLSLPAEAPGPARPIYYLLLLAAAVGLFLLQWWGRVSLLLALVIGVFAAPPPAAFIGPAALLLGGVVLGIAFSPPMRNRFVKPEWTAMDEEELPAEETLFVPIVLSDAALIDVTASWLEASNIEYVVEEGRLLVRAEDAETARSIVAEASGEMRPN